MDPAASNSFCSLSALPSTGFIDDAMCPKAQRVVTKFFMEKLETKICIKLIF